MNCMNSLRMFNIRNDTERGKIMYLYLTMERGIAYVMLWDLCPENPHPRKAIFHSKNWFAARDFMREFAADNGFTLNKGVYERMV